MKKGKTPALKGPGFADAMFSIKDMQMDYASFNQESSVSSPPLPPVQQISQKNPLVSKTKPKPDLVNKPKNIIQPKVLLQ